MSGEVIPSPDDTLQIALSLAGQGWHVFPVRLTTEKQPDGTTKRHKKPLVKWHDGATTDVEQIATWWCGEFARDHIGVHAARSGLVVVDLDEDKGKGTGRDNLAAAGIDLPETFSYRTRGGGSHHVYAAPEGRALTIAEGKPVPGVDIRAGVGLMVYYGPELDAAANIAPAPDWALFDAKPKGTARGANATVDAWLKAAPKGKPSKRVRKAAARIQSTGTGHKAMLKATGALVNLGSRGEPGAADALLAARARYIDGWGSEYGVGFDKSVDNRVKHYGLPPMTFALSKAERKALKARIAPLAPGAGHELLDDVRRAVERFVAFPSEAAAVAVTAWAAHTHLIDRFENTPRLAALSPEPGSGKTRLLEVLAALVHDPVETVNASPSFLARRIGMNAKPPTCLLDEIDTLFGVRSRDASAEETRGIVNSGYRRGAEFSRAAVRGKEVVLESFSTFAPIALAGLGDLPDTVMTRSVIIRMRRRAPHEIVEPYRERTEGPGLAELRRRMERWARHVAPKIGKPWPELPEGIVDRDADIWEPLIAVADAAGGHWPDTMRRAAVELVSEARERPASLGVKLLSDVRTIMTGRDRIRSIDMLGELHALEESPWLDLGGRGPIDSRYVSRTLKAYSIRPPHSIRFSPSEGVAKGWEVGDFAEAWSRYLPAAPVTFPLNP